MRRTVRLALVVVAAALVAAVPAATTATAWAQEDPSEVRAITLDLERLRNNVFFADDPVRVRELVFRLLDRRSARADQSLRELLLDPRSHLNVVEQISWLTIVSPPHALLDDLVARLAGEPPGSTLERRIERALLRTDADVLRRLAAIVRDVARPAPQRRAAIRLLARTGEAEALSPIAEAWAGPDAVLREAAREAFDEAAPGAAATAAEARDLLERLRTEDIPLSEAVRRMLRERVRRALSAPSRAVTPQDYAEMALALLPRASLDQICRLYVLGSPVPDVRAAGAERLATFAYDESNDPDARVHTARVLFDALRKEDAAKAENALLATLAVLAPSVRGGVGPDDMDALLHRVRPGGASGRETRLLAVKLAGELRDERAAPALEAAYDAFGESDDDARLAVLAALQDVPADRTAWLVARLGSERRPRVLRKLVTMLSRSRDPAVGAAFAALLGDEFRADPETRIAAVQSLSALWATRADVAARDALVTRGLADPDPRVRAAAAAHLGIPGRDRETAITALLAAIREDTDADVRRAAARSVIVLDEEGATQRLLDRLRDDPVVADVLREHFADVVRRDQSPDRVLAASDALAASGLRAVAVTFLEAADVAIEPTPRGRSRLREGLARLLLDDGRWQDAERHARALVAAETRDAVARDRLEVLLARALVASSEAARLAEADTRLVALRAAGRLDPATAVEAAGALGDARLRRDDAIGAADVLALDTSAAPEAVRRAVEMLRRDAERRLAAERAEILALVARLGGADDGDVRARLADPERAGIAAWHLARELRSTADPKALRPLFGAASVVTGTTVTAPADDAAPADVTRFVEAAREALARVPRPARPLR